MTFRDDLPEPVPPAVVTELAYLAMWKAACDGAVEITCALTHLALDDVGLQRREGVLSWRPAEGLLRPSPLAVPSVPRT